MSSQLSVVKPQPPNEDLIRQLKDTLTRAENGEIIGMVMVMSYDDNGVNHQWAGVTRNRMRIIGELEQVKWHLMAFELED